MNRTEWHNKERISVEIFRSCNSNIWLNERELEKEYSQDTVNKNQ